MLRSINISAAGIDAQAKKVDVLAHNIANINTTGYKKQDISFSELFYRQIAKPGNPVNDQPPNNTPVLEGSGARVSSTGRDFRQGAIVETGRQLDFAIQGKGFFEVVLPDGNLAYTRAGVLNIDAEGWLVTSQGYPLSAPLDFLSEYTDVNISNTGVVTGRDLEGEVHELGYLFLVDFVNPQGLEAIGDNLYLATEASGELWEGMPGEEGFGEIKQGFLEMANVFLAEEITSLIEAQRAYQLNSRALQGADEMWAMANNLRR